MPVQYGSILEEHRAVRERRRAVRPVAHGRALRRGPGGRAGARRGARHRPAEPRRRPRPLLDDLRARRRHHRRPDRLPPRPRRASWSSPTPATRRSSPTRWPSGSRGFKAVLDDRSLATGLVAVQGPRAAEVLAPLTDVDLGGAALLRDRRGRPSPGSRPSSRGPATPARTGSRSSSTRPRPSELWDVLLDAVRAAGGRPIGLGARDTLRLEAGMPLYGNELDRDTNPYEAGLGRVVKLDKAGDFVGRAALEKVARDGPGPPARRPRSSRAAGSPATATRSGPASGGPASSPAGRSRRRSASRSRWPTSRRPTPSRVPLSTSRSATRASRPGSSPCRSTGGKPDPMVPTDLRYTKDHEWVRVDGDEATIGITEYAADQLGDIVFVELPDVGPHRSTQFGRLRRRRIGQGRQRPVRAGQRRGRRGQRGAGRQARSSSTATRTATAGCSASALADPAQLDDAARRRRLRRADRGGLTDPMPYGPHTADDRARMLGGARPHLGRPAVRGHPAARSARRRSTCPTRSPSSSSPPA